MGETDTLKKWINESNYIVFFGGAGVSTESNIPDFRSTDGLYHQEYDYPPETILSHSFYMRKPEEFYRFYRNKMLFPNAKPNRAHLALAKLEQEGKLKAVITQNIDGLHQAAGSKEVLELHGSVLRNHCTRCGRFYGLDDILKMKGVPKCSCGGVIKPDVVLYEEGLDNEVIERSIAHIRKADMLIIGGTSLVVYPAAGLIDYYHGNKLVLINKSATSRDGQADLVISDSIGEGAGVVVLEELEHAKARNAKIYAEVVGYGATADAYHITSPIEDGSGAARAMTDAMKEAGALPEEIDYINAHGTGTHHNDLFETRAIKAALGEAAKKVKINSTKSMIGHLLGAAGGVEFVVCAKSVEEGFIHQTVGTKETEEELDLDYCIDGPSQQEVKYAMSNSLGFGGHNAVLLLKKYQ